MPRLIVCLLMLTLALAGCNGSSSTGSLSDVKVTGAAEKKPTVTFDQPFAVTKTTKKALTEGDGATLKKGDSISVNYVGVNGRDGKVFDNSFDRGTPTQFTLTDGALIDGFITGLVGAKVGSRMLIAIPPDDGYGTDGQPSAGIEGTDTLLFVVNILSVTPTRAAGTPVAPVAGNPTVKLDAKGVPTVTVPKGPPPTKLVISPLIKGSGAAVAKGQTLTVQYHVTVWSTGKTLESSWAKGTPAQLQLGGGQLIADLEAGLIGQTVGSQVLVVVPQPDGVAAAASSETSTASPSASPSVTKPDALVFVIDILAADKTAS